MKKLLLLFLSSSTFMSAQVLLEENFNGLTVGDVSTEIAGTVPGQGQYLFFSSNGTAPTTSTNAAPSNAQIVTSGNGSLGLQLLGPNGNKGSRFMWKDGFADLWAARTTANDIIELEVDINPGDGTTTSRNTFGAYIFNSAGDRILAGFFVRAATRELFLVAYSTPTGNPVGNYNYSLAAAPGIQIPESTFSRIGISYNKTTGQITIKGPGIAAAGITLQSSSTGTDPAEIDFVSFSGNTTAIPNTTDATMVMDNLVVRATATDTLLDVKNVTSEASFSVYPNPANDIVTITTSDNLQSIELFDVNGRTVSFTEGSSQINVSELSSGIYLMKVNTDKGSATKKIVVE